MQNKPFKGLLNLILTAILSFICPVTASLGCPNCGTMKVPYPLSTSPSCGHQQYKVRCTKGTLWFDTLNGSSYVVTSISPMIQELVIRPQSFNAHTCINKDFKAGGIWLDEKLPFNISSKNTVLKINCKPLAYKSAMNCSSSNIAFRHKKEAAERCGEAHICCSFTGGGSQNDHNIKITPEKCEAYTSFIGLPLDTQLPVSKWPKPGVAIQWVLPPQPNCSSASDCNKLPKSSCLLDDASGQKRCLCKGRYQWDPIHGICARLTYAGGTVVTLVSLAGLVYMQLQRIKRQAREKLVRERQEILNANNTTGRSAKLFSAKEIKRSTKNFSQETILGSGGFGEVYKGKLNDGTFVAVKRSKFGNIKGTDQVLNEVRVLCQVNHRSLVRLLGCCVELEEPVLVYEYINNGTLFDILHDSISSYDDIKHEPLSWHQRLVIAHQIAEGLAYLHFSAVPPIIHRDIKTSNILLNDKFDVKISDFGLSRLVNIEATHMTTCAQGTLGYLDPQYYRNMQLTDKSDVYSFGVVLLELLTSQKAIDFNREVEAVSLAAYIRKLVKTEKLMDAVDPVLKKGASKSVLETMKTLGNLAITCLDDERHNRPSIREVTEDIEYMLHIIEIPGSKA
ncbi:Wall-associated receptor kinase-like 20 [Bienertia sinuspersici]